MILRRFSTELGLQTCTVKSAGTGDVAGVTDRRGFLPDDLGFLRSGTWHEAAGVWCKE